MAIITNFDRLNALRTEAARCGAGSKAWIEFAAVMFDSFPALYQTAKSMNTRLSDLPVHESSDTFSPAQKAVQHILLRMRADGRLAYLIGPGSESFDLLIAAQAIKQGISEEELRKSFEPLLKCTPWPLQDN